MDDIYSIPSGDATSHITVKNSRFIGRACCTPTVAEARAYIRQITADEPGCTHVVYAYIIGYGNSVTLGMSDAGEPPGTAGRPLLEVLKGSKLGDITLVVARYFGGTKLGTGGLVKAYTESAQETLSLLKTIKKIKKFLMDVSFAYEFFNHFERIFHEYECEIVSKDFSVAVHLQLLVPEQKVEALVGSLLNASAGKIQIVKSS